MRAAEFVSEEWSAKYKRSINCSSPKGFSQKAHCAGRNKNENLNEFSPGGGNSSGNYLKALASAWYNDTFNTGDLHKGIKSQEDIERILERGIHCGDGKVRKYSIGYNADFNGVEIQSDDHYEYSDYDDAGNDIDSRTGKPWGPYDVVAFADNELDESINGNATQDAWAAGYQAFQDDVKKCPYAPGSEQAREWNLGWESAQARGWSNVSEAAETDVAFEIDSEDAYNAVLDRFGSVIEWSGDYMVAPRQYWGAIQEVAYDNGGEATEAGDEQLDELSFRGSQCTKDCSGHRAGYEWSQRKGGVDAASWSPSFNKGAWLFTNGH
jgi:hypothetical protein